jgi:Kef-type K+ transport system membrane component KefB
MAEHRSTMPSNLNLATQFFLQLTVVLLACHLIGMLFQRLGQPHVVGQMVAGVLLGPSCLGLFFPELLAWLFPPTLALADGVTIPHPTRITHYVISQVAVALYMFVVGMTFDTSILAHHAREAGIVAAVGSLFPVLAGCLLGFWLGVDPRLFGEGADLWQVAIFLAAATSIAALPVLARIVEEAGLTGTRTGTIALASAVVDDVIAWTLLAVTVAAHRGNPIVAAITAGGTVAYVAVVLTIGRPIFGRLSRWGLRGREIRPELVIMVLLLVMLCSWYTELIGVYAVFGAFIAGLSVPRGPLVEELRSRVMPLTSGLLLPLFFVYAGMDVQLRAIDSLALAGILALVIVVAFVSKAGACTVASQMAGASWQDAAGLGFLMNARGLTGLVLIGIGLQEGILTVAGYTILTITVLLTTLAVAPGRRLVGGTWTAGARAGWEPRLTPAAAGGS